MALTAQQEEQLQALLEAFQNGKRLSDLPPVKGTNPFDLFVEVLDTDGESKKAALATLLPYIEDECSYGVTYEKAVQSYKCTRVGNMTLHKSLPLQNRMRGCLLDDDGNVVEYLNPLDWTGHDLSGARGQCMVELPMHYRKCVTTATSVTVRISEYPLPGYHQVPKMYVGAHEAVLERSTGKLCDIVNMDADYRGGNNNASYDGTYRSYLGRPVTELSRAAFRTAARKRNTANTCWNEYVYMVHKSLYWLYVIEYASRHCQDTYTAELTAEGYHQGGLGDGVTTFDSSSWNNFNGYHPFVPCGHTDSLGNQSGVVPYSVLNADGATLKTFNVPRYRGIENIFGHIWKWTDGINIRISPTVANGGDDLSKVFTCDAPSKFNDSNYTGYKHVGNEARTDGYVKEIIAGEEADIMPTVVGGGSTSYFCDNHYTNIPNSVTLRGVLFGGAANDGSYAGLAFANSNAAPSSASALIGSRLCYIPA